MMHPCAFFLVFLGLWQQRCAVSVRVLLMFKNMKGLYALHLSLRDFFFFLYPRLLQCSNTTAVFALSTSALSSPLSIPIRF
jgi:hypothetical protein